MLRIQVFASFFLYIFFNGLLLCFNQNARWKVFSSLRKSHSKASVRIFINLNFTVCVVFARTRELHSEQKSTKKKYAAEFKFEFQPKEAQRRIAKCARIQ